MTGSRDESFIIRPLTADDAEAAAALSAELGYPADRAVMQARIERLTASADQALFAACRANEMLGWIHVSLVQHLQDDLRAEIGGLIVRDGSRSSGIGARLVAHAEQWASECGVAIVVVRSQIKREAAHRFYLREGYTRTKTSAVFTKWLDVRGTGK
jgi:GNAT superfamily N-acetyltransferase